MSSISSSLENSFEIWCGAPSGIAVETVGDFDLGRDPFRDSQRHAVIGLFAGLCDRFGLTETQVWFHRDFTNEKSCPGTGLDRQEFRAAVVAAVPWAKGMIG